jgi:acylglycerol lipase
MMLSIGYYIKSDDKTNLFFRFWQIPTPKLCVCIIHDIGEHSGRYEEWANYFNDKGIAVTAIDYRGHGKASGNRGHAKSIDKIYEDIDKLIEETEKHFPNSKIILYGNGFGGTVALNYYFKRKDNHFNGLIVSSPWLKLADSPLSLSLSLIKFSKFFCPILSIDNGLAANDISRDKNAVHDYENDPLVHNKISLQLFHIAYNHGLKVSNLGYRVNVPMLLMHGSKDNYTSYKASVLFERDTGKYTTFIGWEGAFHELHNDICKKDVFNSIINWLNVNNIY